jgi:phosphoglycerate dehydrogenase-like enzyme
MAEYHAVEYVAWEVLLLWRHVECTHASMRTGRWLYYNQAHTAAACLIKF